MGLGVSSERPVIMRTAATAAEEAAAVEEPVDDQPVSGIGELAYLLLVVRRRILATTILIGAAIGLVVGILGDYIGVAVAVGVGVGLAVGEGIYQRR